LIYLSITVLDLLKVRGIKDVE
jgi:hypothetical protein